MAQISASDVKELRERTGLGMMDCKKALVDANGNKEDALTLLKQKGLKVAAKRADRDTNQGVVACDNDGQNAFIIQLGCETDFVAKNEDFGNLVTFILDNFKSKGESYIGSEELEKKLTEASGKTGEKIVLMDSGVVKTSNGFVHHYIHFNKRAGVLVELECDPSAKNNEKIVEFANDIALQIAAMNPVALVPEDVSQEQRKEQKEIFMQQMEDSDKPADVVEKIVDGKLNKYFSEMCLMEMVFVKDSKLKIKQLQQQVSKETGIEVKIKKYIKLGFE